MALTEFKVGDRVRVLPGGLFRLGEDGAAGKVMEWSAEQNAGTVKLTHGPVKDVWWGFGAEELEHID
ncbi:hypothetical protein SEA_BEARBQ_45 [Gordonia phage BearBQ]|nr:hypothetical protein SEA_BEARBQ_45 [Gordonia phage BearBQ]